MINISEGRLTFIVCPMSHAVAKASSLLVLLYHLSLGLILVSTSLSFSLYVDESSESVDSVTQSRSWSSSLSPLLCLLGRLPSGPPPLQPWLELLFCEKWPKTSRIIAFLSLHDDNDGDSAVDDGGCSGVSPARPPLIPPLSSFFFFILPRSVSMSSSHERGTPKKTNYEEETERRGRARRPRPSVRLRLSSAGRCIRSFSRRRLHKLQSQDEGGGRRGEEGGERLLSGSSSRPSSVYTTVGHLKSFVFDALAVSLSLCISMRPFFP